MRRQQLLHHGLVAVMTVAALYIAQNHRDPYDLWADQDYRGQLLIVAFHLPLLARHRFPVAVLVITCLAATTYHYLRYHHPVTTFAVALAVLCVAKHRPWNISLPAVVLGAAVLMYGQATAEPELRVYGCVIVTFLTIVAWVFGDKMRQLAERGERLAELTERLRGEQEEREHRAVSREQRRIARELHDVVAHHMSVISVQAGLGRYVLASDVDTARNALQVIGDTAHAALAEMRRLLTVLRVAADEPGSPEAYEAAPGLDRLPELLDRVRAAGAEIDLRVLGEPIDLPPGLDLCAYRLIQECLTNVLKHADPPIATVRLDWQSGLLRVTVEDQGRAKPVPEQRQGATVRHGLIGMRERARIYGGTVHTGRTDGGGFKVSLTLPTGEQDT